MDFFVSICKSWSPLTDPDQGRMIWVGPHPDLQPGYGVKAASYSSNCCFLYWVDLPRPAYTAASVATYTLQTHCLNFKPKTVS